MSKSVHLASCGLVALVIVGLACSRTGLLPAKADGAQATGAAVDSGHSALPDGGGIDSLVAPASPDGGAVDRVAETIGPSLCGNGRFDPGEECDDGNTVNGDGCSSQCVVECSFKCQCHPWDPPCVHVHVCGDADQTLDEECDDGNTLSGDGCSDSCHLEPGWTCVPGRRCYPTCGDWRMVGWETCDDGNTHDGDGCASNCLAEPCWDCSVGTCIYRSCGDGGQDAGVAGICGDGVISPGEQCDDGDLNTYQGYGTCTTRCKIGPFCGDGQVNGPEECDLGSGNGKVLGKAGCAFECTRTRYCGDGFVDTDLGEECDFGDLNGVPLDSSGQPSDTGTVFCDEHCMYLLHYR
jgi:cysteine-rich repeat protein